MQASANIKVQRVVVLTMEKWSTIRPKNVSVTALANVATIYIVPYSPEVRSKARLILPVESEIKNVCPKLENMVSRNPPSSQRKFDLRKIEYDCKQVAFYFNKEFSHTNIFRQIFIIMAEFIDVQRFTAMTVFDESHSIA